MVYTGHRTYGKKSGEKRGNRRLAVQFAVCISAFLMTVSYRYFFSEKNGLEELLAKTVGGSVDYEAAVSVLGEALEGEKSFSGALKEACKFAFMIKNEKLEVAYEEKPDELPVTAETGIGRKEETEVFDSTQTADDTEELFYAGGAEETAAEEDGIEKLVEEFKEKQKSFTGYDIPNDVSYDYSELSFEYVKPAEGALSSAFGYRNHPEDDKIKFHYGIDIASAEGTELRSFADGTVFAVGDSTTYGLYVIVNHADGVKTLYAHLSEVNVKDGEEIKKEDILGKMGDTGNATAPCLHFELIINGVYVNPEYYFKWE